MRYAAPLAVLPSRAPQAPDEAALPLPRTARTIALVDLDSFYVSVERLRDPGLRDRPVIVGGLPGERGVVACASYEARGHGVRAGMPLSEAAALLPRRCARCTARQADGGSAAHRTAAHGTEAHETAAGRTAETGCGRGCPVFLHGDHATYLDASRRVMEVLQRFAPKVEPLSLDEAYLDLSGCERHHRSWLEAAQALRRAVLQATGLSVSVGIGGTRAVAAVAAALAKPAGVLVVRAGEERAFLAALPLEHLPGVGPKMREQLTRFHLLTIGDLALLPDDLMETTFGRLGPLLTRRARGEEDPGGARVGERTPKSRSISRETSFAADTDDALVVDGMLSYLAQRAAKALRDEGLVARSVGVRLRYADFDTVEARQRLPEPTDRDQPILEQVRRLWRVRWTRRVRLRLVGVVLHDLVPAAERQLTLRLEAPRPSFPDPTSVQRGLRGLPLGSGLVGDGWPTLEPSNRIAEHDDARRVVDGWPPQIPAEIPAEVDRAIDRIRDRHGFGAIVRGRAIDLLPRQAGSDPRRRTPARTALRRMPSPTEAAPTETAPRETAPRAGPPSTATPGSWSLHGLRLSTPGCSR